MGWRLARVVTQHFPRWLIPATFGGRTPVYMGRVTRVTRNTVAKTLFFKMTPLVSPASYQIFLPHWLHFGFPKTMLSSHHFPSQKLSVGSPTPKINSKFSSPMPKRTAFAALILDLLQCGISAAETRMTTISEWAIHIPYFRNFDRFRKYQTMIFENVYHILCPRVFPETIWLSSSQSLRSGTPLWI